MNCCAAGSTLSKTVSTTPKLQLLLIRLIDDYSSLSNHRISYFINHIFCDTISSKVSFSFLFLFSSIPGILSFTEKYFSENGIHLDAINNRSFIWKAWMFNAIIAVTRQCASSKNTKVASRTCFCWVDAALTLSTLVLWYAAVGYWRHSVGCVRLEQKMITMAW